MLLPLVNKTHIKNVIIESTLLRPTPKIANCASYWVYISARRIFSASPPGVRGPSSNYRKHIMTKTKIQHYNTVSSSSTGNASRFRRSSDETIPINHSIKSPLDAQTPA